MRSYAVLTHLSQTTARLAAIGQLRQTLLKAHLDPVPCAATCKAWFDAARIPRMKANPLAKRGGGQVYYSVAHVERFLRSRLAPKMTVNG